LERSSYSTGQRKIQHGNSYPTAIYQGGPSYKPYFIAINNQGQAIIGPNKKTVAMYVVRKLKVLI